VDPNVPEDLRADLPTGLPLTDGLAQRASLDYYNGIRTVGANPAGNCRYLIMQTGPRSEKDLPGWTLIREASRPGDKSEQLRLYRRGK
jgi:hypothetical protein